MANIPVTPEVADFVANTLKATRARALKWEPLGERKLVAELDGYQVEIREVSDLDGQDLEPDHVLSLYEGDKKLFAVDRRDVSGEELARALGETVDGRTVKHGNHRGVRDAGTNRTTQPAFDRSTKQRCVG